MTGKGMGDRNGKKHSTTQHKHIPSEVILMGQDYHAYAYSTRVTLRLPLVFPVCVYVCMCVSVCEEGGTHPLPCIPL